MYRLYLLTTSHDIFTAQSATKTPRSLSSVKRASVNSHTESVEERSQVLSALAQENMQVGEYRVKTQASSKVGCAH